MEREKAQQRTHVHAAGKALQVTAERSGGCHLANRFYTLKDQRFVRKRPARLAGINQPRRDTVGEHFHPVRYEGSGFKRIAKKLNEERGRLPLRGHKGWATSGVRELRHRGLRRRDRLERARRSTAGGTTKQRRGALNLSGCARGPRVEDRSRGAVAGVQARLKKAGQARSPRGPTLVGADTCSAAPHCTLTVSPYLLTGF